MFDSADRVEYANIAYNVVDNEEHKKLALDVTQKSIVLLKNENNTLPLKKDIKTLAVIGPNSDEWLMLLGNYNGVPSDAVTPLRGIKEKLKNSAVLYAQGCELADGMPTYKTIPEEVLFSGGDNGLKGEYFDNADLSGTPLYTSIDKNM